MLLNRDEDVPFFCWLCAKGLTSLYKQEVRRGSVVKLRCVDHGEFTVTTEQYIQSLKKVGKWEPVTTLPEIKTDQDNTQSEEKVERLEVIKPTQIKSTYVIFRKLGTRPVAILPEVTGEGGVMVYNGKEVTYRDYDKVMKESDKVVENPLLLSQLKDMGYELTVRKRRL